MAPEQVPKGKCGFVMSRDDTTAEIYSNTEEEWHRWTRAVCCWRDADYDDGRCVLHSESGNKPVKPIIDALHDTEQRTDGTVLRGIKTKENLSFDDCSLVGVDFSETDYSVFEFNVSSIIHSDFSGANLRNATFRGNSISSSNFSESNLREATFDLRYGISGSLFRKSDLQGVTLDTFHDTMSSDFRDANFRDTDLSNVGFGNCEMKRVNFSGANLTRTNLNHIELRDANFEGVEAEGIDLWKSDVTGVNFSGANIEKGNFGHNNFTKSNLNRANFSKPRLENVNMSGMDLTDTTLVGADLSGSDLSNSNLSHSNLSECNFRRSNLTQTDLSSVNLSGAIMEYANISGANLDYTNLSGAFLYQTLSTDTRVNDLTTFDNCCIYDSKGHEPADSPADQYDASTWVYRTLKSIYKQNAMVEQARFFHLQEQKAHREAYRRYWSENRDIEALDQYLIYTLNGITSKHTESPSRVIGISGLLILLFGFLYPLVGGVEVTSTESAPVAYNFLPDISLQLPSWVTVLLTNFYFSAVTFTTLGYGDIQPATSGTRLLASIESLAGALLMALFVYVLGRRATW